MRHRAEVASHSYWVTNINGEVESSLLGGVFLAPQPPVEMPKTLL